MVIRLIFPYAATTRRITVRVAPRYMADQSDPRAPRHVWSYHVRIENNGLETVQLLTRHWTIIDAEGRIDHVDGPGVVGQQPMIEPGGAFDYVSGCPLPTTSGVMEGYYAMRGESGTFDVQIPTFALERPTLNPGVN